MGRVRYGLVGVGGIALSRTMAEGFGLDPTRLPPLGSGHPEAELVAATSRDRSKAAAVRALGVEWVEGYEELLGRRDLDAVYVTTNNGSHFEFARRALLAGKHVLCEKPLATRLSDARELSRLARERNLSLGIDHMMTKNAYNSEARRLALSGAIGAVNDICVHMEFPFGATPTEAASWQCALPAELGGPIGDVGSHCLYMAEYLLGSEVARIGCVYTPPTLGLCVENGAFIQFETAGGTRGTARVAFNQARGGLLGVLQNLGFEIYGTEGVIRSYGTMFQLSGHRDEPVRIRLEVERRDGVGRVEPGEVANIYQAQISEHARSILEDRLLDGSEAIHNLELLELCHESAGRGGAMLEPRGRNGGA